MITTNGAFLPLPVVYRPGFRLNLRDGLNQAAISRRTLYGDRPTRMCFIAAITSSASKAGSASR